MRFLLRLIVTAAALWVAVRFVPGITYTGGVLGLLGVAVVFGLINALVRPLLAMMTCPLVLLTLGLFLLVLNALMLWLTAAVAGQLGLQFGVAGFVPAFVGSLVVSITSAILNLFVGSDHRRDEED
jgi:putative membrane protein